MHGKLEIAPNIDLLLVGAGRKPLVPACSLVIALGIVQFVPVEKAVHIGKPMRSVGCESRRSLRAFLRMSTFENTPGQSIVRIIRRQVQRQSLGLT